MNLIKKNKKCDYIRCSPSEISAIATATFQIYIDIPRKDSVISLLDSYFDSNFDLIHAATGNRYADDIYKRSDDLRPTAL